MWAKQRGREHAGVGSNNWGGDTFVLKTGRECAVHIPTSVTDATTNTA